MMHCSATILSLAAGREFWGYVLLAAGVSLAVMAVLATMRKRRGAPGLTPFELLERSRQQRGLQGDLEELTGEIDQMTQRLGGQLETRCAQLETLLEQADQRIAELRRLQGQGVSPRFVEPLAAASQHGGDGVGPGASPGITDPLARSVYALADEGLAPPEIAKRLNEHIGKVELILALRSA